MYASSPGPSGPSLLRPACASILSLQGAVLLLSRASVHGSPSGEDIKGRPRSRSRILPGHGKPELILPRNARFTKTAYSWAALGLEALEPPAQAHRHDAVIVQLGHVAAPVERETPGTGDDPLDANASVPCEIEIVGLYATDADTHVRLDLGVRRQEVSGAYADHVGIIPDPIHEDVTRQGLVFKADREGDAGDVLVRIRSTPGADVNRTEVSRFFTREGFEGGA